MIELKGAIEEVNFYVSYLGKMVIIDDALVLFSINLGISEHSINPELQEKYIDYSIVLFQGVSSFIVPSEKLTIYNSHAKATEKFYFGGTNLGSMTHVEYELEARNATVLVNEDYQLNSSYWVPIQTPKLPPNMNQEVLQEFLNTDRLKVQSLIDEYLQKKGESGVPPQEPAD